MNFEIVISNLMLNLIYSILLVIVWLLLKTGEKSFNLNSGLSMFSTGGIIKKISNEYIGLIVFLLIFTLLPKHYSFLNKNIIYQQPLESKDAIILGFILLIISESYNSIIKKSNIYKFANKTLLLVLQLFTILFIFSFSEIENIFNLNELYNKKEMILIADYPFLFLIFTTILIFNNEPDDSYYIENIFFGSFIIVSLFLSGTHVVSKLPVIITMQFFLYIFIAFILTKTIKFYHKKFIAIQQKYKLRLAIKYLLFSWVMAITYNYYNWIIKI